MMCVAGNAEFHVKTRMIIWSRNSDFFGLVSRSLFLISVYQHFEEQHYFLQKKTAVGFLRCGGTFGCCVYFMNESFGSISLSKSNTYIFVYFYVTLTLFCASDVRRHVISQQYHTSSRGATVMSSTSWPDLWPVMTFNGSDTERKAGWILGMALK